MLYVKPYGKTETIRTPDGSLIRKLVVPTDGAPPKSVSLSDFYNNDPVFLLSKIISEFDGIARKSLNQQTSKRQRAFRDKLGPTVWGYFRTYECFAEKLSYWDKLWLTKLHPYDGKPLKGTTQRDTEDRKGRWYYTYFGKTPVDDVVPDGLGELIEDSLIRNAKSMNGGLISVGRTTEDRGAKGKIDAAARTISQNIHSAAKSISTGDAHWSKEDEKRYERAGDVAALIQSTLRDYIRSASVDRCPPKKRIGPIFFEQFARLFPREDLDETQKPVLTIKEIYEEPDLERLLHLHMSIKDYYNNAFRGQRRAGTLQDVLPKNMTSLFRMLKARKDNKSVNGLIRLGKVIHYSCAQSPETDTPRDVTNAQLWQSDVSNSMFWTSAGQSMIKRNESFVRIWRGAIVIAAHTLHHNIDPEGRLSDDILLSKGRKFLQENYSDATTQSRLKILFGARSECFDHLSPENRQNLMEVLRAGLENYRNNGFHFKGRGGFVDSLSVIKGNLPTEIETALRDLLSRDRNALIARNRAALEASGIQDFTKQHELKQLDELVRQGRESSNILPRYHRVLDRAHGAWDELPKSVKDILKRTNLPQRRNRREMEKNALWRAQYVAMKMVYETAFRDWDGLNNTDNLRRWRDDAIQRASAGAKQIVDPKDTRIIVSKMKGLIELRDNDGLAEFNERTAEAAARFIECQNNYENDEEAMQRKDAHIEYLRLDVIAQAWSEFLRSSNLQWLSYIDDERSAGRQPSSDISALPKIAPDTSTIPETHALLYALLHLMPAYTANQLVHQMRKWTVLETKGDGVADRDQSVKAIIGIFDLYLSMRDAKYMGSDLVPITNALASAFDGQEVLERVFPKLDPDAVDDHIPIRGLREMVRTGSHETLKSVFARVPVRATQLDELDVKLKKLDQLYTFYDGLRQKWENFKRGKPGLSDLTTEELKQYALAAESLSQYRHLANHAYLVDQLATQRVMMQIFGRLIDYVGMWERDLYFVMLALIYKDDQTPQTAWTDDNKIEKVKTGQSVAAARLLTGGLKPQLEEIFGSGFLDGRQEGSKVWIRNQLAHLNMLRSPAATQDQSINVTTWINHTRTLMSHDRKLKNAVASSMMTLMQRENFDLRWTMNANHQGTTQ